MSEFRKSGPEELGISRELEQSPIAESTEQEPVFSAELTPDTLREDYLRLLLEPRQIGGYYLEKINNNDLLFHTAIREYGFNEADARTLVEKWFGRLSMHLLRIGRANGSNAEQQLFRAHFDHLDRSQVSESERYGDVVLNEGDDTIMYWTISPYLLQEMMNRGIDVKEALRLTVSWPEVRTPENAEFLDAGHWEKESSVGFSLAGTEWMNDLPYLQRRPFFLDKENADHVSHKMAARIAEHVANIILDPTRQESSTE